MTARQIFKKVSDFNKLADELGVEKVTLHVRIRTSFIGRDLEFSDYKAFVDHMKEEYFAWAYTPMLQYDCYEIGDESAVEIEEPFDNGFVTEYVEFYITQ